MASSKENYYLEGKLLLAMPSMSDPRFHRAVIFICSHNEEGTMGLVINHKMPSVEFTDLVKQMKLESDIRVDFEKLDLSVMCGGPMDTARGFMLHSGDFSHNETIKINNNYGITGTVEALKDVVRGKGPKDLLFVLGYAGWDAGQLDLEIQESSWLVVDSDPDIIFEGKPEEKWTRAIAKLGFDPLMLSSTAGCA